MSIYAISPRMQKALDALPKGALQSAHIEAGCCPSDESRSCVWVGLNKGWIFEDMDCGTLHEGGARAFYSVLKSIKKVEVEED